MVKVLETVCTHLNIYNRSKTCSFRVEKKLQQTVLNFEDFPLKKANAAKFLQFYKPLALSTTADPFPTFSVFNFHVEKLRRGQWRRPDVYTFHGSCATIEGEVTMSPGSPIKIQYATFDKA